MEIDFAFLTTIQKRLQNNLDVLESTIAKHGEVIALHKNNKTQSDLVHDYIFLCLTKGTRSLSSSDLLITESYLEDALILARSSYESYLNAAYIYENPDKVKELLITKLGLARGIFSHPLSKSGYPNRKKVTNPLTGNNEEYGVTIAKMAMSTPYPYDEEAHHLLYQFLSEFTHVNIVSSGAYRTVDQMRYIVAPSSESIFSTTVICLYVSWLLLDLTVDYIESKRVPLMFIDLQLVESGELLMHAIENLNFDSSLESLKEYMLKRIAISC
ncbi:hypothetical protein ABT56_13135 [Photobacterium aquae]|uniref:Uncharacterized protein n=1 Tax=Photobacterium aquae TaxID=1195763 RepID=A0A0J1GZT2_9GAMM|nr:DUF5677 domain-containing protein [Photobacterium aquae]KLV05128.1 hypothetical protein ABT56_13135 [Photobacterium aquae]